MRVERLQGGKGGPRLPRQIGVLFIRRRRETFAGRRPFIEFAAYYERTVAVLSCIQPNRHSYGRTGERFLPDVRNFDVARVASTRNAIVIRLYRFVLPYVS